MEKKKIWFCVVLLLLAVSIGVANMDNNTEDEHYEVLLDEVAWSFDDKKYESIDEFYEALVKYNKEIDMVLPDEITYSVGFTEVVISFDYTDEISDEWIDVEKKFEFMTREEAFSELELLFQLHNSIQHLFKDYDHKYLEGIELKEQLLPSIEYELILGS